MALAAAPAFAAGSQCFGTVSKGHVEQSVRLPASGPNFQAYSDLGVTLGRTWVHSIVAEVVADAYAALDRESPGTRYVYGESGLASGGRMRPHRTHQNGLSVDFFVPVRNAAGKSVPLPSDASNHFGYAIEFDSAARFGEYRIDFPALAEHLYQLDRAARAHGIGIALVIFDRPFLPKLLATPRGAYLREHLKFMKGRPWIRHDEHYHVDFAVPCKPEISG